MVIKRLWWRRGAMARFYKVLREGNENSTVKGFLGML